MAKKIDISKVEEILERGVAEVIDKQSLKKKLLSGRKLRIKLGIDPTSPNLHLGRAVPLLKLKDFQDLGHQIVLIIGDFTGVIGDTSDKESERPMLDSKTVKENLKTYVKQAGKILDMKKVEINYNSKWLSKLTYKEIGEHANIFSLAEFTARENIKKRLDQGKRVSLREILYPLMQGYDSIAVNADVELGGTDQRFNLLSGREMQRHYGKEAQDILMGNLIEGTDGRKMSSSWGNTINLLDEPKDMFGKIMSSKDELIVKYFIHCTRVSMETVREYEKEIQKGKNPKDIKMILAYEITKIYWGDKKAKEAQDFFVTAFEKKEIPQDVPVVLAKKDWTFFDVVVASKFFSSKSEIRRLFEQKSVRLIDPQEKEVSYDEKVQGGTLKVGKKNFFKVIIK